MQAPATAQPPARILVVDDEPRNLEVITMMLEAEGHQVLTAGDGAAALAIVAERAPDLVLLDVMMPGPDGFEVCRRIKERGETAFLPVVILTALRGVQDRVRGAAAGADEFLSKPFDGVELLTRVRALLRSKRYHDALLAYNAELEQRVAERTVELQRALADLRALDRLKSEFIGNVSHELRTPLLHVKGYVDLLAAGAMGPLTPKQAEGLAVAQAAIERLQGIVLDVLDFRSLQQTSLALEPVSVTDVCRNVVEAAAVAASRRNAHVRLDLPPDSPRVRADRAALARVLRHLLDNAIKFGPPGQDVQVAADRLGQRVRLSVRDQGPGLDADDQSHIFDLFYQADGSSTREAGGLGLGLALVSRVLEAHGSQIHVSSAPGEGSEFWFELESA